MSFVLILYSHSLFGKYGILNIERTKMGGQFQAESGVSMSQVSKAKQKSHTFLSEGRLDVTFAPISYWPL